MLQCNVNDLKDDRYLGGNNSLGSFDKIYQPAVFKVQNISKMQPAVENSGSISSPKTIKNVITKGDTLKYFYASKEKILILSATLEINTCNGFDYNEELVEVKFDETYGQQNNREEKSSFCSLM